MKPPLSYYGLVVCINMVQKVLKLPAFLLLFILMTFPVESGSAMNFRSPLLPPVAVCRNISVQLGAGGSVTISAADINAGSYDPDGTITNLIVSPNTFNCTNIGSNNVVLTVMDNEGLSASCNAIVTVSSTLEIASMILSTCEMSPTLALFEAEIEGGNGNYSYFWKGLNPSSKPFMIIIPFPPSLLFSNTSMLQSPFFNNTMANGYYDIRLVVTDGNGCTDSSDISVNKTGEIFNNQTMRNSQACEEETMTYSVNYKDDAVYSWSVTNGTILESNQDTSRINVSWNPGAVQGTISTTIRQPNILFSGELCESTITETITIIPVPTPAFSNPVTSSCPNSVYTYTLTDSYTYQNWTVTGGVITAGGSSSENFVSVRWGSGPAGTVSVSAGNNSKCTGAVLINVSVSSLKGTITSRTDIKCNGGSDGSVTVAATPGTGQPPYSYSLDGGTFQSSGSFTGIPVGNHIVRIRDASTCTFDLPFDISQPGPLSGSVTAKTDIFCFGEATGSVTITGSGGVTPYMYQLGAGTFQTSGTFGSLIAGNYSITVRDANLCTYSLPVTIKQPSSALAGTIEVTSVSCFGASSGACNLTITGGTSPYSFLWSNGAITEDIANLSSGNYSMTVTDALGCKIVLNAIVSQPVAALGGIIASQSNVTVYGGSDGSVTVSGVGGTSPYEYSVNGGIFQSSGIFGSLSAGVYTITVRDAGGCTKDVAVTITQPLIPLTANIKAQVNVPCHDGSGGSVTVEGWGGVLPYLYSFEGGEFQVSGTYSSLNAGTYTITVKDAALNLYNITIIITEPEALNVYVSGEDIQCFGGNTGSVNALASGGTSPYTYSWNSVPVQNNPVATGLTAGTYTVTVTDAGACTVSGNVTISQPATDMSISISQVNVMCSGGAEGSASATATGGLAPYTYTWNTVPAQTKETATDLSAGTYIITVTDSHGCVKTRSVTITEAQPITIQSTVTPTSCPDSKDGSIILTMAGGTSPFNVLWSDGFAGQNRSGLAPGSYSAAVTDQHNCGETITVDLEFTFTFGCLVIPQVITPNNDGFNDDWRIRNIDLYPAAEIRVFNRWGKMIFSTRNPSDEPWDGTIGGKPAPTDSYRYIIYLNDGSEPRSGVISVIR